MKFLTIGTGEISNALFIPVSDKTIGVKPNGGLWLTEYDQQYQNYNIWVEFLINNPTILFYKNHSENLWQQPCSLVTLKSDAQIFNLDNNFAFEKLLAQYPLDSKRFSYNQLSKDYDGIFVDVTKLFGNNQCNQYIYEYAVSSLVLFNLKCIDYYQSGIVTIEPFSLEYYMYENGGYEIIHEKIKKKVK